MADDVTVVGRGMLVKSNTLIALGRRREGIGLTRTLRDVAAENGLTDLLLRATGNLSGHMSELDLKEAIALNKEVVGARAAKWPQGHGAQQRRQCGLRRLPGG